jgi:hypothetical protein
MNPRTLILLSALVASAVGEARADQPRSPTVAASAFDVDFEIDPLAYALGGHSLHAGIGRGRVRLDLGAFAAQVPALFHGNAGFDVAMSGFGAKLDVFLSPEAFGPFAGVEASWLQNSVQHVDSGIAARTSNLTGGLRVGWRIGLPGHFYVTPWLGVGLVLGAEDRMIGGGRYQESRLVLFPTVHVGRLFRGL